MRLLADENFPGAAVAALQAEGHDVLWIRLDAPGSHDQDILRRAQAEDRIVLTFDKDFGELAFRWGLPASSGVILFRIPAPSPESIVRLAIAALQARSDWAGHFSVVERNRIRMRPLSDMTNPPPA